jgi:hypothetical protein
MIWILAELEEKREKVKGLSVCERWDTNYIGNEVGEKGTSMKNTDSMTSEY